MISNDDDFVKGLWNKYDNYSKSRKNDKFYSKHIYKNTDLKLGIHTFFTFTIMFMATCSVVYAGVATYNFIQNKTNTDFNKNKNYDYSQDMIYDNDKVYYKKITSYNEYKDISSRWDNLVDIKENDFQDYFVLVLTVENTSMVGINITNITSDDDTMYVEVEKQNNETNTVISSKIGKDLERKNIDIVVKKYSPNILNYAPIEDLKETYSKEEAKSDGCFVIENGKIISDKGNELDSFIDKTKKGEPSTIRIVYYNNNKQSENVYYNQVLVTDIEYKENKYYYKSKNLYIDFPGMETYENIRDISYLEGTSIEKIEDNVSNNISYRLNAVGGQQGAICTILK